MNLFSGTTVLTNICSFHPFGCPVYVLHNTLQARIKISKWDSRSRLGLYLGPSPRHARSVGLVLNLRTGLVSPQFHMKFDDYFETVMFKKDNADSEWKTKCQFVKETTDIQVSEGATFETTTLPLSIPVVPTVALPPEPPLLAPTADEQQVTDEQSEMPIIPVDNEEIPIEEAPAQAGRWSRRHKPTQRLKDSWEQGALTFTAILDDEIGESEMRLQDAMMHPIAFAASADPDNMYMEQAIQQPDKKEFIKAMISEVQAHTANGHWEIIPRTDVPVGTKVLPAVWAMKRKRRIATQEIYKWKARLNIHGGKQEKGINYWETYAATLAWPQIRFMFTLSIINSWHTRQIDFTMAYPQADVECDLYMDIPKGFEITDGNNKDFSLKIIKNLYGQKQAGRTWALHLRKGLLTLGFTQSSADDCIFYKDNVIFMVYVDDGIFLSPFKNEIDDCIRLMQGSFRLTDEGEVSDYMGIKVSKLPDRRIQLKQPQLIDSIVKDMNFATNTNTKEIPALSSIILKRDLDGEPF